MWKTGSGATRNDHGAHAKQNSEKSKKGAQIVYEFYSALARSKTAPVEGEGSEGVSRHQT